MEVGDGNAVAGTSARPASGPPRRSWGSLSRDQIVTAALRIARRDGLDALSIRRLASELGASRMAIYRHVANKDALLDFVTDAIAEEELIPPEADVGPWDQRLCQLARAMRRQLLAYPGLTELVISRGNMGPSGLRHSERILAILESAGLGDRAAARYYFVFVDVVVGRVHREVSGDFIAPKRMTRLLAAVGATPHAEAPRLHRVSAAFQAISAEELFEAELDMLIQGIRAARGNNDGR